MNERIKEIADEAFAHFTNTNTWSTSNEFCEKFAELIVRECIRYFNEDYNRNFATLWREDLSIGVKQHFGVKE
jgi:hypothetical protein